MESVSSTRRFSRSTTVWNASAPATRVTGSKSTRRMWPLRESSSLSFSSSCSIGVTSLTSYEYGSATPSLSFALPCSSNSIGRFLKHMSLALPGEPGALLVLGVGGDVALDLLDALLLPLLGVDVHAAR